MVRGAVDTMIATPDFAKSMKAVRWSAESRKGERFISPIFPMRNIFEKQRRCAEFLRKWVKNTVGKALSSDKSFYGWLSMDSRTIPPENTIIFTAKVSNPTNANKMYSAKEMSVLRILLPDPNSLNLSLLLNVPLFRPPLNTFRILLDSFCAVKRNAACNDAVMARTANKPSHSSGWQIQVVTPINRNIRVMSCRM